MEEFILLAWREKFINKVLKGKSSQRICKKDEWGVDVNSLNHFVFAFSVALLFMKPDLHGFMLALMGALVFGVLIDLDHKLNKNAPWYHKRTWVQEPLGLLIVGLPLACFLGFFDQQLFYAVLAPYASHVLLDYLCVFEAEPFAPLLRIKKREGLGLFVPDDLFHRSINSARWKEKAENKGWRAISENYFTPVNLAILALVVAAKFF